MLPRIHAISLSAFRASLADALRFVVREGGNLWLTHRGRPVAVVVRMEDAERLAALHGQSVTELLHRIQINRARIIAARNMDEAPLIAAAAVTCPNLDLEGNQTGRLGIEPGTYKEHLGETNDVGPEDNPPGQCREGPG